MPVLCRRFYILNRLIMSKTAYITSLAELLNKNTNVKLGLTRIEKLLTKIPFSRASKKIIQVVGTNGKGSTVAFLESILKANNYTTGLFTSPHLCTARERIRINKELISEDEFVDAFNYINNLAKLLEDQPSFFECMLAMALWVFERNKVEIIILEAGLGGRLDATTAVNADILGVTTLALDHQKILGSTLEIITQEKIAAARPHQPVISVIQEPSAQGVLKQAQQKIGFTLRWAQPCLLPLGLYGDHQKLNAGLALALISELKIKTQEDLRALGLLQVSWPGRFEVIRQDATIILDGAHNISGIRALISALKSHVEFSQKKIILVFGSLDGQPSEKIKLLLAYNHISHIFLHSPNNTRAETQESLRNRFYEYKIKSPMLSNYTNFDTVKKYARKLDSIILVCGSLYTVGEIRAEVLAIRSDTLSPNF
jgi:dihydrofolate synthase/folylpolyglutamate synthase